MKLNTLRNWASLAWANYKRWYTSMIFRQSANFCAINFIHCHQIRFDMLIICKNSKFQIKVFIYILNISNSIQYNQYQTRPFLSLKNYVIWDNFSISKCEIFQQISKNKKWLLSTSCLLTQKPSYTKIYADM